VRGRAGLKWSAAGRVTAPSDLDESDLDDLKISRERSQTQAAERDQCKRLFSLSNGYGRGQLRGLSYPLRGTAIATFSPPVLICLPSGESRSRLTARDRSFNE
jgi:hypothetical protein